MNYMPPQVLALRQIPMPQGTGPYTAIPSQTIGKPNPIGVTPVIGTDMKQRGGGGTKPGGGAGEATQPVVNATGQPVQPPPVQLNAQPVTQQQYLNAYNNGQNIAPIGGYGQIPTPPPQPPQNIPVTMPPQVNALRRHFSSNFNDGAPMGTYRR